MGRIAEHHDRIARHVQLQNRPSDGDGADLVLGLGDDHAERRRLTPRAGRAEGLVHDAVGIAQHQAAGHHPGRGVGQPLSERAGVTRLLLAEGLARLAGDDLAARDHPPQL